MKKINGLRFIIGSACNYNCFYCHHEGYRKKDGNFDLNDYIKKINSLKEFCIKNNILDIAITGGEPFLYKEKLNVLFDNFAKKPFRLIVNTNASLLKDNLPLLEKIEPIELHVNLSTLRKVTHKEIIGKDYFDKELESLNAIKGLGFKVKLNIICLKGINEEDLLPLNEFAKENGFIARYLVFYDNENKFNQNIMSVNQICEKFKASIKREFSYGLIETEGENNIEIVKCLCDGKRCDECKKSTYMHISPELNIKYCLESSDEVEIDFATDKTIEESFDIAIKKLEEI